MLKSFPLNICPLVSICFAIAGCGKKIVDPSSKFNQSTQNQTGIEAYFVSLDGSISSKKRYRLNRTARFEIPRNLRVMRGSSLNKVVEIAYDVNEFDSEDIQFKCSYVSSADPTRMVLKKCMDYDGNDFGDVSGHEFGLYYDDLIEIRFTGAPAVDLKVEGVFEMRWI